MNKKLPLVISLIALAGLAGCNNQGMHSGANFHDAGQALGNGNVGSGANYTAHGFGEGAKAVGQGAVDTAHSVKNSVSGNQ